jgi:hypothetical protein
MIAKLTGNTLWLASMTEHTREKNLIFRETFGEEGKGRTGLTPALVLRWMQEGGLLVLDEIHKPIEGVAVLNNILQNGEYRMDDGRVVRYDPAKSFVIATMNPAKPPYKGEPPSGELASRFGLTLNIDYLPPDEEEALLDIFMDGKLDKGLIIKLVAVANELRRAYPEFLPLPVAPRTLIHIARQIFRFPDDDKNEIFLHSYNPFAVQPDPAVFRIVARVLFRHDLDGRKDHRILEDDLSTLLNKTPAKPASSGPVPANVPSHSNPGLNAPAPAAQPAGFAQSAAASGGMPFTSPVSGESEPSMNGREDMAKCLQSTARLLSGILTLGVVPFHLFDKLGENAGNTRPRWRTFAGFQEIQFLPEDLDGPDRDLPFGRLAHEVWHLLYSRPELIFEHSDKISNMAFQALWWAVEDPRINNLGLAEHPGAEPWLDAAYGKDYAISDIDLERMIWRTQVPLHLQFNYAIIYRWWTGREDPRVTDPRVKKALQAADKPLRKAFAEPDARRAFDIVLDEIWPVYEKLLLQSNEQALEDAAKKKRGEEEQEEQESQDKQGRGQGQGGQGEQQKKGSQDGEDSSAGEQQDGSPSDESGQGGKSGEKKSKPLTDDERRELEQKVREEMKKKEEEFRDRHGSKGLQDPEKMPESERQKAKERMEKAREEMEKARQQQEHAGEQKPGEDQDDEQKSEQSRGRPAAAPQDSARQKERLSRPDEPLPYPNSMDWSRYEQLRSRVARAIPVMRYQFIQALKQRLRRRVIHGRDSGDLDPDAFPRIPMGDRNIFTEEMLPDRSLYRISLLVDTSASMDEELKTRAAEGLITLMESLELVPGVQFEIVKYDSEAKVLKPYSKKLSKQDKVAVIAAIFRGTGNTQAHDALKDALVRVRMGRGDRMIILVNDGDPDKNFDRDLFRKMITDARDVETHGIGLGPKAQMVIDLFPPGLGHWLQDAAEFAARLREILKKKLLGGK